MSIQDNLKKMFTNEEQTVLWKTDIWGTIAVYLTCISCTRFGTSDLNILLKPFYYRLVLLVPPPPLWHTRHPGEKKMCHGAGRAAGRWQGKPKGPGHWEGSRACGVWAPPWCWGAHFGQGFPNLASLFFLGGGTHNFWLLQAGWCSQGPSCHLQLAAGLAAPKASLPVQVVSEWLAGWAEQGECFPPPHHLVFGGGEQGQAVLASSGPADPGELGTLSTPRCPASRAQRCSCSRSTGFLLRTHWELILLLQNAPPTLQSLGVGSLVCACLPSYLFSSFPVHGGKSFLPSGCTVVFLSDSLQLLPLTLTGK